MSARIGTRRGRWSGMLLAALLATACGKDPTGPGDSANDPALAPFVGDWSARVMVVTSVANPLIAPDLIKLGATFTLNVQPSGQYTAILLYEQQAGTEIGTIAVSGSTVTWHRTFPSVSTSSAVFAFRGDLLILDGDTEFDFNLDGTPEPALAHIELGRK